MADLATIDALARPLLDRLLEASIVGGLAVAAVWLLCRLVPGLPARWRAGLWWLASLKLLLALAGFGPLHLPVSWLPASAQRTVVAPAPAAGPAAALGRVPAQVRPAPDATSPSAAARTAADRRPAPASLRFAVAPAAVALWFGLALAGFVRVLVAHRQVARLARRARPADRAIARVAANLAVSMGLRPVPVRESARVGGPLVCGAVRPVVLLPAGAARQLSDEELELALCHELLHVRNGDLWWALVPELAVRLLPFHPLAALARREHLLAREAACDADVLATLRPAPDRYGTLLVTLGTGRRSLLGAAALGAASHNLLARRLTMLQHALAPRSRRLAWIGALAAAALVVAAPVRLVGLAPPAEPAPPARSAAPAAAPRAAASAPPHTAPAPPAAPATTRRVPPTPPAPPSAPAPPVPPALGDLDLVLVDDGMRIVNGGSTAVLRARLAAGGAARYLWVERAGESYLVTDPALVAQARAAFEMQAAIGESQGRLGARQGELGAQQGELGAQQAAIGAEQAGLAARQAQLAARGAALAAEHRAKRGDAAAEAALEAELRKIEHQMEALGREKEAFGGRMEALGREQAALGRQQEALGAEQEALAREQEQAAVSAGREVHKLVDEAIASGKARKVD